MSPVDVPEQHADDSPERSTPKERNVDDLPLLTRQYLYPLLPEAKPGVNGGWAKDKLIILRKTLFYPTD